MNLKLGKFFLTNGNTFGVKAKLYTLGNKQELLASSIKKLAIPNARIVQSAERIALLLDRKL